jgi:hypothetical protein
MNRFEIFGLIMEPITIVVLAWGCVLCAEYWRKHHPDTARPEKKATARRRKLVEYISNIAAILVFVPLLFEVWPGWIPILICLVSWALLMVWE